MKEIKRLPESELEIMQIMQIILDRLFNGSLVNFASALCDSGVKKEEVEELKRLLEKWRTDRAKSN